MSRGPAVDVWTLSLDAPPATLAALAETLSPAERERAARCRFDDDRRRFVMARGGLRRILGRYLGVSPEELDWQRGRHGKPGLAGGRDLRFNLSHSGGLALVAVTRHGEVGVDVDRPRPGLPIEPFAARFFPPAEAGLVRAAGPAERAERFLRLWTRKEAVVKAAGGRLVQGLRVPVTAGATVRDPRGELGGDWSFRDVPVPSGYVAAVAVEGALAPRVSVRHAHLGSA
ncbi:4'-phosphopantetheinyl transferase family protein [Spirillospora sp. CA-294931]|uniref:4'-phosphopantetheinyl transferase family protein n=1 Tax=Spirillospora sp. CA-294931 TaxID=3240042 RepID=UPI003D908BF5